jgi:hypothetical protein
MTGRIRLLLLAVVTTGVCTWDTSAADPEAIRRAIDRGINALKKTPIVNLTGPHPVIPPRDYDTGATALIGLTLLEGNVPATDPAVQRRAILVRLSANRTIATYSLALAILFLDRLGDPNDNYLIQVMGVRLLQGQTRMGGWGYTCSPPLSELEVRRLETLAKSRTTPANRKEPARNDEEKADSRNELPPELKQQLAVILRSAGEEAMDDNSNTQFAILGLWVAGRHGVPIDQAVGRIENRFRTSQAVDGGWEYHYRREGGSASTPAMTCAGLLGLAVSHGASANALPGAAAGGAKDQNIRKGLAALGGSIDHPLGARRGGKIDPLMIRNGKVYYFLWSMERVAVVYGIDTIGGKDWYNWGADYLLALQLPDGTWRGEYASFGADTCFALLFLMRANPARDLTAKLQGAVKDPGEVVLTTGGVGGANLQQPPRLTSPLEVQPGDDKSGAMPKQPPGDKPPTEPVKPSPLPTPSAPDERKPPSPLPAGNSDPDATRLTAQLVDARGQRQVELLAQLRDGKGNTYTQALADAIPKLNATIKDKAREALAERLARMTSATLGSKLEEADPEVRRAAALAVYMRGDKTNVPKLIDLLGDPEPMIVQASLASLKGLSGKDFGPTPDARRDEVTRAVAAWKSWWAQQGGK